jgi:hypothetical protein
VPIVPAIFYLFNVKNVKKVWMHVAVQNVNLSFNYQKKNKKKKEKELIKGEIFSINQNNELRLYQSRIKHLLEF